MQTIVRSPLSFTRLLFVIALALALPQLHAQRPLITQPVSETSRVTMHGNVHSLALGGTDLGPIPSSQPTGTLMLVLGRSVSQQSDLDSYVIAASTPGSDSYQRWLTPAAFNSRFGANSDDILIVERWLESSGFTVEQVSPAGNVIRFAGTMGAVNTAFRTEMRQYEVAGTNHIANAIEPSIPAALAGIVRGFSALNDYHPISHIVRGPHPTFAPKGEGVRPQLTVYGPSTFGPENYDVYYLPAAGDAAVIYDTPNHAMNPAYTGTTLNGAGVTIGIVGDSNLSAAAIADIARYRSFFLNETLAQAKIDPQLPIVVVDGTDPGVNGDEIEALVDVEQAAAFAPKALTTLYTAANTDLQSGLILAIQRAVNDNSVSILNISFGNCEEDLGASTNALINEVYEQAAAQGISITVSAGDSGAAGCDANSFGFGATTGGGLAVNGLASTPWNVAVGGTDFDVLYSTSLSTSSQYIQVPATTVAQLGTAPFYGSALGYIPEEPWNDSSYAFSAYPANVPYKWGNGPENTMAGGGGISSSAVCSGTISSTGLCSGAMSGYSKPAFQASLTPTDAVRDVPDVSFFSGSFMSDDGYSQYFNAAWSICSDNTVNGDSYAYTDCVPKAGTVACNGTCAISATTSTTPIGGTSTAAPSMAGILALVIQHMGGQRLGQADYGIYNLAATKPADFHDVTIGNNSVLCKLGSLNCGANGFINGYNAGPGYDLASGIGSIDVAKFVNDWSSIQFATTTTTLKAGTSTTALSTNALTVAHGTTIYLSVGVSPSVSTGNVALITNSTGANSVMVVPIINGVATFSTQALPGGTYTLYARYGGNTTSAASQSQGIQVTVSPETSTMQFNLNVYNPTTGALTATSPANAVYGSQFVMDVTPYGGTESISKGNPATGIVTFSQGSVKLAAVTLNSEGMASYALISSTLPPGQYTFTAAYSGGGGYNASSTTQTVTITKSALVLAFINPPNGTVLTSTGTTGYGVSLTNDSYGAIPTGTITFAMDGVTLSSDPVYSYACPTAKRLGCVASGAPNIGTTALLASQIGSGNTVTISATYSGDSNYASVSFSTSVSVTEPASAAFTVSAAGPVNISAAGQPGASVITTTPTNGFGGTVSLTCALASGPSSNYAPTCSIPASVSISGTAAQQVTLTISTTGSTTASTTFPQTLFMGISGGGLSLAGLLFFVFPKRRRRWLLGSVAALAVLLTILLPTTGCGGGTTGGGSGIGITGTPAGRYTFTITGTHGSTTNSTTLTVVVA